VPEELNQFDFLSRCERIWADSAPAGEGMLFTRIFNYQVKFVTGYEDGLRLVLCRVEVGARSHPPQVSRRATFAVKSFDLIRRMDAYDGSPDGEDWNCPVKVPMRISRWDCTLAEIDRQDFKQLREQLGDANFQTIVETQRFVHPQNELSTYRGEDDLPLRYYIRKADQVKVNDLILVSFGEFQPCRWVAHIEGIWQIIEEDEPTPESKPVEAASIPEPAILNAPSPEHQQLDQGTTVLKLCRLASQQRIVLQFLAIAIGVIVAIRIAFWIGGLLSLGAIAWILYQGHIQQRR
jgi:hypothetical protein